MSRVTVTLCAALALSLTVAAAVAQDLPELEFDRMGYLIPALTQDRLDNQRDVVRNEKRQGENQPYAVARQLRQELLYPGDHPYHHTVIGSTNCRWCR